MQRVGKRLDPIKSGDAAQKLGVDLRKRVVGQDEAIDQIVSIYQTFLAGMNSPGRPIGNFLFLGPTGTGKTRLVEALAESMVGDPTAVVKIDCAEFQHSHEIAKLIGSPPGYLGHRETHPLLSQEALNQYHTDRFKVSFVLFDEIEKASDALWNLLLGILDKGVLTLGDNRRVDFTCCMIFMTSNLGTKEMGDIIKPQLGFGAGEAERERANGKVEEGLQDKVNRVGQEAARRKFTPEFMNRLDRVVVFRQLETADLRKILEIELAILQERIFIVSQTRPFVFNVTKSAKDFLLREGTDLRYGARHLKRTIERSLVHPLSNLIASDQIKYGDLINIEIDTELGILMFTKEAEDIPGYAMVEMTGSTQAFSVVAGMDGLPHMAKVASTRPS